MRQKKYNVTAGLLWQLYPLIFFVGGMMLLSYPLNWTLFLLLNLLPLLSLALLVIFPVPTFPPLSGPHKVAFSVSEEDSLPLYTWYPTTTSTTRQNDDMVIVTRFNTRDLTNLKQAISPWPHMDRQVGLLFSSMGFTWSKVMALLFSHLRFFQGQPDVVSGGPLLPPKQGEGGYPIIVFSHGLYGAPSLYSFLCSDLASHGFIVVRTVPL